MKFKIAFGAFQQMKIVIIYSLFYILNMLTVLNTLKKSFKKINEKDWH